MSFNDEFENNIPDEAEEAAKEAEEAISDAADEVADAVEEAREAADEVADAVEEAGEAADEFTDNAEESVNDALNETEEFVSDINDAAEETGEEFSDEANDQIGEFEEAVEENIGLEEEKKKSHAPVIIGVIVVLAAAIIALCAFLFGGSKNPYNDMGYLNPSGKNVKEVAESMGMSLEDFLAQFGLPADMPEDTTEMAAYYSMPLKNIASMYGTDVDTLKEQLKIPDETTVSEPKTLKDKIMAIFKPQKPVAIDENTPWGLVEDEITIGNYYGEDNVEEFKKYYDLGDDVTADTKYKDVRPAIDAKTLEMMAEQEEKEQQEEAEEAGSESSENEEQAAGAENAPEENPEGSEEAPSEDAPSEDSAE